MNSWWSPFFSPPQEIWCCKSNQKQKHYWYGKMPISSSGWCGWVNVGMSTLLFKVQGLIRVHVYHVGDDCKSNSLFSFSSLLKQNIYFHVLPYWLLWLFKRVYSQNAEKLVRSTSPRLMEYSRRGGRKDGRAAGLWGGPWHAIFRTQHSCHNHELTAAEQDLHKIW